MTSPIRYANGRVAIKPKIPPPLLVTSGDEKCALLAGKRILHWPEGSGYIYLVDAIFVVPNMMRKNDENIDSFGITDKWLNTAKRIAAARDMEIIGVAHSHTYERIIGLNGTGIKVDQALFPSSRDLKGLPKLWLGLVVAPYTREAPTLCWYGTGLGIKEGEQFPLNRLAH